MPVAVRAYRRSDFSWTCLTLSFQTEINATHQRSVQESFGSKIVRVSEESRKLPVALEFREPTQRWKMPRYYGFRKNRKQLSTEYSREPIGRNSGSFNRFSNRYRVGQGSSIATYFSAHFSDASSSLILKSRRGSSVHAARSIFNVRHRGGPWFAITTFDERVPLVGILYTYYDQISSGPL